MSRSEKREAASGPRVTCSAAAVRISAYTPATHVHEIARTMGDCARIELAGRVRHRFRRSAHIAANHCKPPVGGGADRCRCLQGFCSGLRENSYRAVTSAASSSYIAATSEAS